MGFGKLSPLRRKKVSSLGGKTSSGNMTQAERSERARKAAETRWARKPSRNASQTS